jgi:hypothetical protein
VCLLSRARQGIEQISACLSAAEVLTVQPGGNAILITVPATVLSSAVNATHTTLHVRETAMLPLTGVVYIEEEAIAYGGKDTKKNWLLSCARGYDGTVASKHGNKEIVYIRFIYYLNGTTIFRNADGSPSPATDEPIVEDVEPLGATGVFQLISAGSSSFRKSRVLFSFTCYNDTNNNGHREASERSLDVASEVFARNT